MSKLHNHNTHVTTNTPVTFVLSVAQMVRACISRQSDQRVTVQSPSGTQARSAELAMSSYTTRVNGIIAFIQTNTACIFDVVLSNNSLISCSFTLAKRSSFLFILLTIVRRMNKKDERFAKVNEQEIRELFDNTTSKIHAVFVYIKAIMPFTLVVYELIANSALRA